MVYVVNKNGQPLMPCSARKARLLLREKASVVNLCPFTIQLHFGSSGYVQPVSLGVDAGSKTVGISATTDKKELYASECKLRTDIVELLATRSQNRRTRRNRLRYRKPRFDNRISTKKEGWLAPSIRQKIESHLKLVRDVHKILPISKTVVEVASFDIQKIQNPDIQGSEYQQGSQLNFWNVREYVLYRDNHKCQNCLGKSKDSILNVHHIESRKTGGNSPSNLITLCESCHNNFHKGTIKLKANRSKSLRDAAFMGVMRWAFYNQLKSEYQNVFMTYGYITKNTRIQNKIEKTHASDARCISGNAAATPLDTLFQQRFTRKHNRQIHKANLLKGNKKRINQAPYKVFGFKLWDKVLYDNKLLFISGRRSSGHFVLKTIDGVKISDSISYKKLKFIETCKRILTQKVSQEHSSNN